MTAIVPTSEEPPVVLRDDLLVLGTVQGLVSEADRVEEAARLWSPTVVGLGVGQEDVTWLAGDDGPWTLEHDQGPSPSDELLLDALRSFGDVAYPPPDLLAGIAVARDRGLNLVALDGDEAAYLERFTTEVSTMDLVRRSLGVRRLGRRGVEAANPWDLVRGWESALRRIPAYDRLARWREEQMARSLHDLVGERVLAIVEIPYLKGTLEAYDREA